MMHGKKSTPPSLWKELKEMTVRSVYNTQLNDTETNFMHE